MFVLYLRAWSHNYQLLCLVLLLEKEIFVSWKGELHKGNCISPLAVENKNAGYLFLVVCSNRHFSENVSR